MRRIPFFVNFTKMSNPSLLDGLNELVHCFTGLPNWPSSFVQVLLFNPEHVFLAPMCHDAAFDILMAHLRRQKNNRTLSIILRHMTD